tara:strand:+ start:1156 stop:1308 length:153 start_codon:yes stop_codon:yes gene_type:complete
MDEKDWPSIHKKTNAKPIKTNVKPFKTKDGWKLWPVHKAKKKIKTLKINA